MSIDEAGDRLGEPRVSQEAVDIGLVVDQRGQWFVRGAPIENDAVFTYLARRICVLDDGRLVIRDARSTVLLEAFSPPLTVLAAQPLRTTSGRRVGLELTLNDGRRALIDPGTLALDADGAVTGLLLEVRIPVRFSRQAQYALGEWLEHDPESGTIGLRLGQNLYPIRPAEAEE